MFKDDVSDIPTTGCNVLNSQSVIYNYYNGVRSSFVQIGGKWIKNGETTYSYYPSGLVCINVNQLNSNAQFEPIFYSIAFMLFITVIVIFRWSIRGILGRY